MAWLGSRAPLSCGCLVSLLFWGRVYKGVFSFVFSWTQHRVSQGPPRAAARVMCFWLLTLFRSHGSPPLTRQLCQICSAEHLSKRLARSWSITSPVPDTSIPPPPNPKKRQARANSAWLTQPLHRNPPWPWPWRLANPTVPTPCLSKSQRQAFESKVLPCCNAPPTPGLQRGSPKSPKPRALKSLKYAKTTRLAAVGTLHSGSGDTSKVSTSMRSRLPGH